MSKSIATIDVSSDTFQTLIAQVNAAIDLLATEVVTANNEANGAVTTGNGYVNGTMSALVFAANTMRGGNVQSSQTLNITSNLNLTGNTLSIGNSTVNAVANSSAFTLANSSVTFNITKPTAAFVSAGNYALLANGTWQKIIASPNNEFYIAANVHFQQNTVFNATTTTFNSNVVFNSDFSVSTIAATSANLNGATLTGNSTYVIVQSNLAVNGAVSYNTLAVNGYSVTANLTVLRLGPKVWTNNAIIGPNTTAYVSDRFIVSDGNVRIHSTNSTAEVALKFSRSTGQVAYIGSPQSDPDALYIYGPNAAASGIELAATYTQENWSFYTGGSNRITIDENGRLGIGNTNPSKHVVIQGSDPTLRIQIANGSTVDLVHSTLTHDFTLGVSGAGGNSTGIALRATSNGNLNLLEHAVGNVSVGATFTSNAKMSIYGGSKLLNLVTNTAVDKDVLHIIDTVSLRGLVLRDSGVNSSWMFRGALGNSGVQWLSLNDNGRVAIGRAEADALLDVNGTMRARGNTEINGRLNVTNSVITFSQFGAGYLQTNSSGGLSVGTVEAGLTLLANNVTVTNAYTEITGIPSTARRVIVQFKGLITSQRAMIIQLGDSGGIESSGYSSITAALGGGTVGSSTAGILLGANSTSTVANFIGLNGQVELTRFGNSNLWYCRGYSSNGSSMDIYSTKELSGTLTQISFNTTLVSQDYSNGVASVWYE